MESEAGTSVVHPHTWRRRRRVVGDLAGDFSRVLVSDAIITTTSVALSLEAEVTGQKPPETP